MKKADACVAGCPLKPQAEAWGYMLSPLRGEEPATEDGLSTRETYPVTTLKRCFVRRSKEHPTPKRAYEEKCQIAAYSTDFQEEVLTSQ